MNLKNYDINFLAGSKDSSTLSELPFRIYDKDIINFLSELSKKWMAIFWMVWPKR